MSDPNVQVAVDGQEQTGVAAEQVAQAPITPAQVEFLGKETVSLVQMPDGSIATNAEVQRMFDEGHERSGAYGANGSRE